MVSQIQIRRDILSNWLLENPVLSIGEFAYETDTGKLKIGDGVSLYSNINYFSTGEGSGGGGVPAPIRFFSEGIVTANVVGKLPKLCEAGTISTMLVYFGGLPSATIFDSSNYIEFKLYRKIRDGGSYGEWIDITSTTDTKIDDATQAGYNVQQFNLDPTTLAYGDLIELRVSKTGDVSTMGTDLQCMIYYDS